MNSLKDFAKNFYEKISLPQQTHMKTILKIAPPVALVVLGIAIASANSTPNYTKEITTNVTQANDLLEKARNTTCEYIGTLTAECYGKQPNMCKTLQDQEDFYQKQFNGDAYDGCFHNDAQTVKATDAIQPASPQNPLFFGDEESSQTSK